jgi:hypothetical protein
MVLAALLAAGCSFAPTSESGVLAPPPPRSTPPPPLPLKHEFAPPGSLVPGEWVRLRVELPAPALLTIGVAASDQRGRAWIEVIDEEEPRRASLRLVNADGTIERALYRELPDGPIVVQPVTQSAPDEEQRGSADEVTSAKATEQVGDRTVETLVETSVYRDQELGRETREIRVWSGDVPRIVAGSGLGGLVREETPSRRRRVVAFGNGYKPAIAVPR